MNKLLLKKEIFEKKIIETAIKGYCEICKIELLCNEDYFEINFTNTKYDLDLTMKEFENYIIDLMVMK